ncbi:TetR/AcrR family transcriptional regulator [Pseudooceanicola sp. 200-1SW]|uniref:TetR/AcrR family transcriptional regulator n=1 Tax=Pseudooceanicola sp. 200-1SW TaxID=3425949 RepID=UPI003D7FD359
MAQQAPDEPRKIPRQARAKATVEAIVMAATHILEVEGFEAMTTANVADRAGVSIGSLYQYFPDKRALAATAIREMIREFVQSFETALASRRGGTLADTIDTLVDVTLVRHPHMPGRHRMLVELAPRLGLSDFSAAASREVANLIYSALADHRGEIASDLDLADAATMIETLLETLGHRALLEHPVSLQAPVIAEQSRRLMLSYLKTPFSPQV